MRCDVTDDWSQIFVPPGLTLQEMLDKPYHVYHQDFLDIIGKNPTLTLIGDSGTDPVFHEANVW
jgi:gluconolactonase